MREHVREPEVPSGPRNHASPRPGVPRPRRPLTDARPLQPCRAMRGGETHTATAILYEGAIRRTVL